MSFQPYLYKLYYSDTQKYESEYNFRFNQDNTVHINIQINGNPCFIYPDYRIYERIIDIYKIDSDIKQICSQLPDIAIKQFQEHCLIGEIYQSNSIEGVSSTRKEISEVLQEVKALKKERNLYGIVSQYNALANSLHSDFQSCKEIRDVYDKLFRFDIEHSDPSNLPDGEIFRRSSVSVVSETQKEIHRGAYPESEIISTMNSALTFLHSDVNALIRIAAFHYLFGYIHPFYDGNGRMSRFISSTLLMQELNNLIGFRISYTIKDNLSKYYKAFKICNDPKNRGDISPFVKYFLDMLYDAEEALLEALSVRNTRMKYYNSIIDRFPNIETRGMRSLYEILIQATLFSHNGITLSEIGDRLDAKYSTVVNKIKHIPEWCIIKTYVCRTPYIKLDLSKLEVNE